MAFIIRSKSKAQRRKEDVLEYNAELERKAMGKLTARTGRPGETNQYPDIGEEFWAIRAEQARIEHDEDA